MNSSIYKQIGSQIKLARTRLGISQEELAQAVNVERTSITNIEAGRQKLPIDLLYFIAVELGVQVHDLLPNTKGKRVTPYDLARPIELASELLQNLKEIAEKETRSK